MRRALAGLGRRIGRVMYVFPQYTDDRIMRMKVSRFRWLESEARHWRRQRVIDGARSATLAAVEDKSRQQWMDDYEAGKFWRESF